MRADLLGDVAAGADRDADDDEVGAFRRSGVGFDNLVGDAEFGDAAARGGGARRRHDLASRALGARRARDRRADQANADQRQAIEHRSRLGCGLGHYDCAKKSLNAATTRRFASSVPTLKRSAFGNL